MLAKMDPLGSALDLDHLAAEVRKWDQPPLAGVAGRAPVVSEEEVATGRDQPTRQAHVVAAVRLNPRLGQRLSVDQDRTVALAPTLAGQPDDPLDEEPARAALLARRPGCLEDDDVAAAWDRIVVRHRVDTIFLIAQTPELGPAAVERRLHRRRGTRVEVAGALRRAPQGEQEPRARRGPPHQWNEM